MADDWPFLHLNTVPSHVEPLGASNDNQELSLLPFDPSHLEAWTNITFQFDEPNVLFNNPPAGTSESPNSNSNQYLASSSDRQASSDTKTLARHDHFHTGSDIQFQLANDHHIPSFMDSRNPVSNLSSAQHLTYLDRSSDQLAHSTSDDGFDGTTKNSSNNTSQLTSDLWIKTHHRSTTSASNTKYKPADEHLSPAKNDPTSPNSHQTNSNHGSNDDDADNRIAYDEDKRRRNTLASARFRMKKKMKEQEIERTAREMRDKVSELEKEVDSLKQENKWLRGLIVDSTASKIVSVQAKDSAELNHADPCTINKRANPLLGLTADSIRVPSYPQKRIRLCSSPTSTTVHSTNYL